MVETRSANMHEAICFIDENENNARVSHIQISEHILNIIQNCISFASSQRAMEDNNNKRDA